MTVLVAVAPAPSRGLTDATTGPPQAGLTLVQLHLSVWQYRFLWWSLVAVYLFVTVYLFAQSAFYIISNAWPNAGYFAETFQLLPLSGFGVAAAVHGYVLLLVIDVLSQLVMLSVRARRLSVTSAELVSPIATLPLPHDTEEKLSFSFSTEYFDHITKRMKRYLHVRGEGYEVGKLGRDFLQICSLSLQAYDSSRFVVSYYLNLTYIVLIAATCLSGPVVQVLHMHSPAQERLATLVVDLFVDATYMVLPMALYQPYMAAYTGTDSLIFQDDYGARAIMELRILFVASYFNLVVKMVPVIGVLDTTSKIRELMQRPTPTPNEATPSPTSSIIHLAKDKVHRVSNQPAHLSRTSIYIIAGTRRALSRLATLSISDLFATPVRQPLKRRTTRHFLSLIIVTWGVIASVAFSVSTGSTSQCPSGCALILHPWFEPSQCRCAVQIINCHTRGIQGREHEIQAIFTTMENEGLATLIFLHCSALEIPPEVHWFRDLYQFEIYNSSIVSWPVSAALSSEYYRRLGMVYLVRTNLSSVPEALLSETLPKTLKEIGIVVSRLTSLPDDLHEKWSRVQTLSLDHGQFSTFPLVLGRMKLKSLSMYNNSLTSIPEDAFLDCAFQYLLLNRNPITSFPSILGDTLRLHELQLQYTNISSLAVSWSQVLFAPTTKIYARGSPICGDGDLDTETDEGVTVICAPFSRRYGANESLSYYTLEGKTEERRIAR